MVDDNLMLRWTPLEHGWVVFPNPFLAESSVPHSWVWIKRQEEQEDKDKRKESIECLSFAIPWASAEEINLSLMNVDMFVTPAFVAYCTSSLYSSGATRLLRNRFRSGKGKEKREVISYPSSFSSRIWGLSKSIALSCVSANLLQNISFTSCPSPCSFSLDHLPLTSFFLSTLNLYPIHRNTLSDLLVYIEEFV